MDSNGNGSQKEQKTRLNSLEATTDKFLGLSVQKYFEFIWTSPNFAHLTHSFAYTRQVFDIFYSLSISVQDDIFL